MAKEPSKILRNVSYIMKTQNNAFVICQNSSMYVLGSVATTLTFGATDVMKIRDDETKTAIGVKGDTEIKITIGENVLYKNGEIIEIDCAAEITNDRTMVPVRAISEAFGCTVEWNDETKTVEITN